MNYGLRFARWQLYLDALGHRIRWRPSLHIYLAGFALTTTPGKAGELLRGVLLHRLDVPYRHSFAAFFSERMSDLLAIVLLTLLGLSLYPNATPLIAASIALTAAGLLVLTRPHLPRSLLPRIAGPGRLRQAVRTVLHALLDAQSCHRPGILTAATLLSVVAWAAEALAFWWMLSWMGIETPFAFAAFVYAVAMLSGALSFLPGGLGGAEAIMVGLLIWQGASTGEAVAATLLIRLTTLWFAVFIGAAALLSAKTPSAPPPPSAPPS